MTLAEQLLARCRELHLTVATAESLTAGLVASAIADVPRCSDVFRGGVVAYADDLKRDVLGLDAALLEHVVSREVAEALARRACAVADADLGLGTTGVAGPDPLDGQEPGTAWVAAYDRRSGTVRTRELHVTGDRRAVRESCVQSVLAQALALLGAGNTLEA